MPSTNKPFRWNGAYALSRTDDDRLVACVRRGVVAIDTRSQVRLWKGLPVRTPSTASFSPDGRTLAVKSTSGAIVVIGAETGLPVKSYGNQHEGEGAEVHFGPNGDELVDGSWEGLLTVRRCRDGAITFQSHDQGTMITRISCDQTRSRWLVQYARKGETASRAGCLHICGWPIGHGHKKQFEYGMHIEISQISPDGREFCFISSERERRLHVARSSDGGILRSSEALHPHGLGNDLVWSPDGRYVVALDEGHFLLFRASDLTCLGRLAAEYPFCALFLSGGDSLLGTPSRTARLSIDEWVSARHLSMAADKPTPAGERDK